MVNSNGNKSGTLNIENNGVFIKFLRPTKFWIKLLIKSSNGFANIKDKSKLNETISRFSRTNISKIFRFDKPKTDKIAESFRFKTNDDSALIPIIALLIKNVITVKNKNEFEKTDINDL